MAATTGARKGGPSFGDIVESPPALYDVRTAAPAPPGACR